MYIEGVLGAGKSSLLNTIVSECTLTSSLNIVPIYEPVHRFIERKSIIDSTISFNPLKLFKNNKTEGLACQLHILQVYQHQTKIFSSPKPPVNKVHIWDRGLSSCLIFSKTMNVLQYLTDLEYDIFQHYYNLAQQESSHIFPKSIIFLDTPVETCLTRLQARGNDYDEIDHTYLTLLREKYLQSLKESNCRVNIISGENLELSKLTEIVLSEIQAIH